MAHHERRERRETSMLQTQACVELIHSLLAQRLGDAELEAAFHCHKDEVPIYNP